MEVGGGLFHGQTESLRYVSVLDSGSDQSQLQPSCTTVQFSWPSLPEHPPQKLLNKFFMAQVILVEYENNVRCLAWDPDHNDQFSRETLSFAQLGSLIRELLHMPASAKLDVTYLNEANHEVAMSNDQDMKLALLHQSLNPLRLRLSVTRVNPDRRGAETGPNPAHGQDLICKMFPSSSVVAAVNELEEAKEIGAPEPCPEFDVGLVRGAEYPGSLWWGYSTL